MRAAFELGRRRRPGVVHRARVLAVALLAGGAGAMGAWALSADAATGADTLSAGGTLAAGQALTSADGHYTLVMQSDGNLVDYVAGGRALWSTHTFGEHGVHAVLQQGGNLVLYQGGAALWSSNSRTTGCPRLVMQDDGNAVVYATRAIWATHTIGDQLRPGEKLEAGWSLYSASPEDFRLLMQDDGNLVLYDAAGTGLWSSHTYHHPGAYAVMQGDGNLVVYGPGGHALWASNTPKHSGAYLVARGGGNLVVVHDSTVLWSSHTAGRGSGGTVGPKAPAPVTCPPPTTSTTTTTPPPPVVTTPVPTPLPEPPPAPRALRIRVTISWTWNRATTLLRGTRIGSFPWRTQLLLVCEGHGCPRHRRISAAGHRGLHRLLRGLRGHRYRAGDRLLLTLRAPGYRAERAEMLMRWGRRPRVTLLR